MDVKNRGQLFLSFCLYLWGWWGWWELGTYAKDVFPSCREDSGAMEAGGKVGAEERPDAGRAEEVGTAP